MKLTLSKNTLQYQLLGLLSSKANSHDVNQLFPYSLSSGWQHVFIANHKSLRNVIFMDYRDQTW